MSNLAYIKSFRGQSRLTGQDEYYVTAFESALEFIINLMSSNLKLTVNEVEKFERIHRGEL